jgi:hypothetical protein
MLAILEATQAAYGYLPVAALKRISQLTGAWYAMIYGTASYYRHLRFEPAASEQAAAVDVLRPPETSYTTALGAALTGAGTSRRRTPGTGSSRTPGAPGTPGKPARA